MEQDDCSSCSSFPPLESSNDTEIVNISRAEQDMFLIECLLETYRMAVERVRLGQDNGGVPESVPQHPQDDVEQDPKAEQ